MAALLVPSHWEDAFLVLVLGGGYVGGPDPLSATTLPPALACADNAISDEGCKAFCEALKTNATLTAVGLGCMPPPRAKAPALRSLAPAGSPFVGEGATEGGRFGNTDPCVVRDAGGWGVGAAFCLTTQHLLGGGGGSDTTHPPPRTPPPPS